jgi:uncharacterized membrane protein required for colicin V production
MFESIHFGIIDISIIVIALLFAISGFKNGLFKELKGIAAFAAAIVLTYLLADFARELIAESSLQITIYDFLFDGIFSSNASYTTMIDASIPNALNLLTTELTGLGLPGFIAGPLADTLITFQGTIGNALATVSTHLIVLIASYAVTFLIFWILMLIVFSQLVSLTKSVKFIKFIDQVLGIFLGLARAALVLAVFFAISIPLTLVVPAVNEFFTSDLALETEAFSIGKYIFEFALGLIDNIL